MGNWARRALRDWRVWALTLTIQGPGARAVFRYAPWPALVFPAVIGVAVFVYGAILDDGPFTLWMRRRRIGSRLSHVVGVLCVVAAVNLLVYPRVDALKSQGRGSDEDDALIETAQRLVTGHRPLYVATYLGNTPSVGLGWVALVAPLAVTGWYALLTPLACGVLVWVVRRAGGADTGTALALLLPLTSPAFWELSVTGSDLFAIGVLFVALTALAARWRSWSPRSSILLVVLVVAASSTRAAFAWVTACVSVFMWRRKRSGALLVGAATAAVVAIEGWWWWPDRTGATPLYLISKLIRLLGAGGMALSVVVALGSAAWAIAQRDDEIATWWRGVWVLLVVPLEAISLGLLMAIGWHVANWQAASYVEVAVPSLVACVARSAALREGSPAAIRTARTSDSPAFP